MFLYIDERMLTHRSDYGQTHVGFPFVIWDGIHGIAWAGYGQGRIAISENSCVKLQWPRKP